MFSPTSGQTPRNLLMENCFTLFFFKHAKILIFLLLMFALQIEYFEVSVCMQFPGFKLNSQPKRDVDVFFFFNDFPPEMLGCKGCSRDAVCFRPCWVLKNYNEKPLHWFTNRKHMNVSNSKHLFLLEILFQICSGNVSFFFLKKENWLGGGGKQL